MKSERSLAPVNDKGAGNAKTDARVGETQPRKPYNAPRVMEHGSVEKITGFFTNCIGSGCTAY